MTDDFTVFWRNDEHASTLFYDLIARAEKEAYDDDFLALLAAYRLPPQARSRISLPHSI